MKKQKKNGNVIEKIKSAVTDKGLFWENTNFHCEMCKGESMASKNKTKKPPKDITNACIIAIIS